MKSMPVLVDIDPANLRTLPCCGIKNSAHGGRCDKIRWIEAHLRKGLRAKVLLTPDKRQCGYIEYLPGEYAWRGVEARGYMFLHCIWTFYKQYQHQGMGRKMLEACIQDAADAGMHGVAVVARDHPWLARPALFLANGFETLDTAPPDYQLLVRKLNASAPNPSFQTGWETKLRKYGTGLTILRSEQCPHISKFADEIAESAEREYGIVPRIVRIRSHCDAQNAPTPYAVFALIYEGRVVADHQISRTRFRNIMKKLQG